MKKILVVIDMQNDLIDGILGTPEAKAIVNNVKKKISQYDVSDIFFTRCTHEENYLSTNKGRSLPVEHCMRGSDGWQLHADISTMLTGATRIDKPCFGSVELGQLLSVINRSEPIEIELVGLQTDTSILANALILSAFLPNVNITVDSSCCAGITPEGHKSALEIMKSSFINVI